MKNILIDITGLTQQLRRRRAPDGIPRVTMAYLRYFLDDMQALVRLRKKIFILPPDLSKKIALLLLEWNSEHFREIFKLVIKEIFLRHGEKLKKSYFLFKIDQGGLNYPAYLEALADKNIQLVAVIHDLIPIEHPEYVSAEYTQEFTNRLSTLMKYSKGIITVSKVTQDALTKYALLNGKNCPPILTARLASGLKAPESIQDRVIAEPYFVAVGTIGTRKNHLLLLQIWRDMARRLGNKTPKLVIIGKRSITCEYTLAMLDHCKEIKKLIIETWCTDQEMIQYLQHAQALLFPSFAEGYGLPLVEALSLNVPVIASDLHVFREIAGDIPDYINPIDALGWMSCIESYAEKNNALRLAQLDRIKSFYVPRWEEHFSKVELFLNRL